jgi:hypothetical protein
MQSSSLLRPSWPQRPSKGVSRSSARTVGDPLPSARILAARLPCVSISGKQCEVCLGCFAFVCGIIGLCGFGSRSFTFCRTRMLMKILVGVQVKRCTVRSARSQASFSEAEAVTSPELDMVTPLEDEEELSQATLLWRAVKLPLYSVAIIPPTVGNLPHLNKLQISGQYFEAFRDLWGRREFLGEFF